MAFNKKVTIQLIARLLITNQEMTNNVYRLNKSNLKIRFMFKYLSSN